jgi:hypothetical protein
LLLGGRFAVRQVFGVPMKRFIHSLMDADLAAIIAGGS